MKIVIVSLFMSVIAFATGLDCEDDSKFSNVSKEELTKWIAEKSVFIVDVNSEESYKSKKIPTAVHYNAKTFDKKLPAKKDIQVVAYCGGPMCTAWKRAAKHACKKGYSNVKHFKGGIKGWQDPT